MQIISNETGDSEVAYRAMVALGNTVRRCSCINLVAHTLISQMPMPVERARSFGSDVGWRHTDCQGTLASTCWQARRNTFARRGGSGRGPINGGQYGEKQRLRTIRYESICQWPAWPVLPIYLSCLPLSNTLQQCSPFYRDIHTIPASISLRRRGFGHASGTSRS